MAFSLWLTLLVACVVISFTPGAGAINTMGNALNHGFRRAIWGILGQQAALIVHIAVVALGVGVLVASSPVLFNVIRYAGAAYLAYLGLRLILRRPAREAEGVEAWDDGNAGDAEGTAAPTESRWSMFRRGLWVNLLNPKAIVFFLAFLPQFIRPADPLLPQYATVAVTAVAVDIAVMWGFFAVAAHGFRRFTRTARGQRTIDVIFGILFLAVALLLALLH
ncbi:MAG: LysE family transporter [Microbacterium sp.]|uniref:LysE family translocator n=1 Tax=Microbacterium sp. TaxID=51671 RepID=UPI001ACB692E|nr:LysE family transporter [Microbacterium sp.]MBN9176663.1 LysE family transporter [Microbacterium sp.]